MAQIDSSIYNAFAPKIKSVADYDAEARQSDLQQLNLLRGRQEVDEYNRGVQEKNALRDFKKGLSGVPEEQIGQKLIGAGFLTEGLAFDKGRLANQKEQAEIKDKAADWRTKNAAAVKRDAAVIMQDPRPETIQAILLQHERETGESMQVARDQFARAGNDPDAIRKIASGYSLEADKLLPNIQKLDNGGTNSVIAFDPLTNKPIATNTYEKTQSPDNAATTAASMANNAATNATTLQAANIRAAGTGQNKPPPGYRWTANGDQEVVPGGPADFKRQGALNADTQALNGSTSSFDRLAVAANEVLKHRGLDGIVGWQSLLPNARGGDAADAQAKLDTLKSQVGFSVLQDMRNNSKTGGALGSVSDKENAMLQSNLAALDKAQSPQQMRESLKKIVEYAEAAKARMRDAYNLKHGDKPAAAGPGGGGDDPLGLRGGR